MERLTKIKLRKLRQSFGSNALKSLYSREVSETTKDKSIVSQRTLFVRMTMTRH